VGVRKVSSGTSATSATSASQGADDPSPSYAVLRKVRFLQGLSQPERIAVLQAAMPCTYLTGSVLAEQGDPADRSFLLVNGSARYFFITTEGQKVNLFGLRPATSSALPVYRSSLRLSLSVRGHKGKCGVHLATSRNPDSRYAISQAPRERIVHCRRLPGLVFGYALEPYLPQCSRTTCSCARQSEPRNRPEICGRDETRNNQRAVGKYCEHNCFYGQPTPERMAAKLESQLRVSATVYSASCVKHSVCDQESNPRSLRRSSLHLYSAKDLMGKDLFPNEGERRLDPSIVSPDVTLFQRKPVFAVCASYIRETTSATVNDYT